MEGEAPEGSRRRPGEGIRRRSQALENTPTPFIDPTLLLPALLAAAAYTLTPGPAFLALLGIGATQGRRAGIGFLAGHLAGDVMWASLALVAIIGA